MNCTLFAYYQSHISIIIVITIHANKTIHFAKLVLPIPPVNC
mgnify:CR=1 FL=1